MMEQTAYATAPPVLYELSGVEKSCEGPAERITILKNMDLTVRAGESLAIVGASGSGKSTLLHLLGALDTPTAGKVLFEGKSLPDMTPVEKAHFRNKKLGFVFQFHHLLPEFSTEENVAMQALIAGMNRSKALGLARQALERVGLSDRKDHRVTTLSVSAPPLRGPSCWSPACCWPTSRPATWTSGPAIPSPNCFWN